jgi:hypothetical protein
MRKLIHGAAMALAVLAGTIVHTPSAKAGVDECTYAAWQFCEGVIGPDGQYLHPGATGWLECVSDSRQYMAECNPPPSTGPTGQWCYGYYGYDTKQWHPC